MWHSNRRFVQTTVSLLLCGFWLGCNEPSTPQATQTTNSNRVQTVESVRANLKPEKISPPSLHADSLKPEQETNRPPTEQTKTVTPVPVVEVDTTPADSQSDQQEKLQPPADVLARANAGDKQAQREVGEFYGKQSRFAESNEWYRKAAEQGDAKSQHIMGVRYTFGQGVEKDSQEAGRWFLLAAEQGDPGSQYSIGVRWARGEAGEPQDLAEAAKWFRLAAEQGHGLGQLSLARRYANGEGVEQDYIEAYKWMWLAKNHSDVGDISPDLKTLAAKMTPEQIAQAKLFAKGFTPQPPTPLKR